MKDCTCNNVRQISDWCSATLSLANDSDDLIQPGYGISSEAKIGNFIHLHRLATDGVDGNSDNSFSIDSSCKYLVANPFRDENRLSG